MHEKYIKNFWEKVKIGKKDDCWLWIGAIQKNGYGNMTIGERSPMGAHRISYMIHFGDIPKGLYVCHKCDVKRCVNPNHLFLGTNKDNLKDMREKGRSQRGTKNGGSKLTPKDVRKIRTLLKKGIKQAKISKMYGVAQNTISRINTGQKWGWLD